MDIKENKSKALYCFLDVVISDIIENYMYFERDDIELEVRKYIFPSHSKDEYTLLKSLLYLYPSIQKRSYLAYNDIEGLIELTFTGKEIKSK